MRIRELDALRGLAVLLVIGYHYSSRVSELYPEIFVPVRFPFGEHGVELFFVISGFVIFMSLQHSRSWREFARSRFARLYPAYWAACTLTFVIVSVFGLPGREVSFAYYLVNLSMFQTWFGVSHVDGAYWSLVIELCFYLLLAIFYFGSPMMRRQLTKVLLIWLLWLIAGRGVISLGYVPGNKQLETLLFLRFYGHLFAAGIAFYEIYSRRTIWLNSTIVLLSLATHGIVAELDAVPIIASFYLFFGLFVAGRLGWFAVRPLLFFGDISYCLYLVHQNIGYVIIRGLYPITTTWWVSALGAFVGSTLIATLLTYSVERPTARWIKRRVSSVTSPPRR